MKRIFVESLAILFACFIGALVAYEILVYELAVDYEFVLEDDEALAHQQLLQNIADHQGGASALAAMKQYAQQSHLLLQSHERPPAIVSEFFNENSSQYIYFDEDRTLWFRLAGNTAIFSYVPDHSSLVRQKIDLEEDLAWIFMLGSFVLFNLVNIWLILRRVRLLENTTRRFARGDLSCRAELSSSNRLGSLNQSFNDMADRIAQLIESNRALTNAIAHELRTPIFRVQWQAELLQETKLDESQAATVDSIIEDSEEMEQMVDELLHYTRMESDHGALSPEPIELAALLNDGKKRWQKDKPCAVNLTIQITPGSLIVVADKRLLMRALDNLVRNAFKYADNEVRLVCYAQAQLVYITVHDDGPGVALTHQAHIFEPFYVADKARNKAQSGHGLGLSIVRKICDQHFGTIEVGTSEILNGAMFILALPASAENSDK
ncbi:two-component sensor histidine kinase [Pseudoalteromonas rubra]|uniref:histidine kinase n=1 Tax=Pseudoalteromonas rubra TaxID=43658 RepID=A0A5S3WFC7_9GAMM|nr:ATP-binding protein [Pseudoalteromonas rubra]TMP24455.1 two-component sensor histidine kinase [Pseudoalteromonas rubra]TMP33304.1 two-component sensor histidine kinase [Pseudoalteromonas rubra]